MFLSWRCLAILFAKDEVAAVCSRGFWHYTQDWYWTLIKSRRQDLTCYGGSVRSRYGPSRPALDQDGILLFCKQSRSSMHRLIRHAAIAFSSSLPNNPSPHPILLNAVNLGLGVGFPSRLRPEAHCCWLPANATMMLTMNSTTSSNNNHVLQFTLMVSLASIFHRSTAYSHQQTS